MWLDVVWLCCVCFVLGDACLVYWYWLFLLLLLLGLTQWFALGALELVFSVQFACVLGCCAWQLLDYVI